jgi:hypothetical protein
MNRAAKTRFTTLKAFGVTQGKPRRRKRNAREGKQANRAWT